MTKQTATPKRSDAPRPKSGRPGRRSAFAVVLIVVLFAINLPFGGIVLYPAKILATWLHETSHAIAMLCTGCGVDRMFVFSDTSGLTFANNKAGPIAGPIIAAAGYMGTSLFGAVLLVTVHSPRAARIALSAIAVAIAFVAITIIVNDFGLQFMLATAGAILLLALVLPPPLRVSAVQAIAALGCTNALLDIRVLFRPSLIIDGNVAGMSDASTMAALTFGTRDGWAQWFWAGVWLLWSLAVFYGAMRIIAKRETTSLHEAMS